METFENKIKKIANEYRMFNGAAQVVVGLSGGADSVCLLLVLDRLKSEFGYEIHAVHVNHMIRGEEADRDEAYARELCEKLNIPLSVVRVDVPRYASENKLTEEEAGRQVRYQAFKDAVDKLPGKTVIAVAHNRNDVAETVVLNMARGTGVYGIKGIPVVRDNIVRPLIRVFRYEIEEYLQKAGYSFCTDSTNLDTEYTRNKIRNIIFKDMEDINKEAVTHIAQLADDATKYADFVGAYVEAFLVENVTMDGSSWKVDIDELLSCHELIRELVIKRLIGYACGGEKDIGMAHVREVCKLFSAESGASINLPHGAVTKKVYNSLLFAVKVGPTFTDAAWNKGKFVNDSVFCGIDIDTECEKEYVIPETGVRVKVKIYPKTVYTSLIKKEYTKVFDYDKIRNSICLRTPRENDYIVINKDGGTKKINRLFSSCKIPQEERAGIYTFADGDQVMWAVGVRMSEAYKVDENTRKIIEICVEL